MPKASTSELKGVFNATAGINDNFAALAAEFDNCISRDGTAPNPMAADLDMNGHDIVNMGLSYAQVDGYFLPPCVDRDEVAALGSMAIDCDTGAITVSDGADWTDEKTQFYTPTAYMQAANGQYASATNNVAQYPTAKPYEYIWGGVAQWQTDSLPGIGEDTFISKWASSGTNQSYIFGLSATGAKVLRLYHIVTHPCQAESSIVPPFLDGELGYVRCTVDVGANEILFYTSPVNGDWTQLGSSSTITVGIARYPQIKSAALTIGNTLADTTHWTPRTHYAQVKYSDDSEIFALFDPSGQAGETSWIADDRVPNTWNLTGASIVDI